VKTVLILVVVEPVVDGIPQDLLDLGSGPDHIGLDRFGREWRVGSVRR
jgi:hypothetical protein